MEPSPVKRKYGDRQSTSSEENETLVEILKDYVSEDDPDYVPEEHESEETSEESENEEDKKEEVKECLDLTHELDEVITLGVVDFLLTATLWISNVYIQHPFQVNSYTYNFLLNTPD